MRRAAFADVLEAISGEKTAIMLAGDFAARDTMYAKLFERTDPVFARRRITLASLPSRYQHETVQLWELTRRHRNGMAPKCK